MLRLLLILCCSSSAITDAVQVSFSRSINIVYQDCFAFLNILLKSLTSVIAADADKVQRKQETEIIMKLLLECTEEDRLIGLMG